MYTGDPHVKTGNIFLKEILFGLMKKQSFPWMYNLWMVCPSASGSYRILLSQMSSSNDLAC